MGVEGEEEDLFTPGLNHGGDLGCGGGVAVTHAEIDHDMVAVLFGDGCGDGGGLVTRDGHQGAFALFMVPDEFVIGPGTEGAFGQDDQLQQGLPFPAGIIDDAFVGQEFVQIAAHGPVIIVVRRAEVGEQHTDFGALHRGVRGGGMGEAFVACGDLGHLVHGL